MAKTLKLRLCSLKAGLGKATRRGLHLCTFVAIAGAFSLAPLATASANPVNALSVSAVKSADIATRLLSFASVTFSAAPATAVSSTAAVSTAAVSTATAAAAAFTAAAASASVPATLTAAPDEQATLLAEASAPATLASVAQVQSTTSTTSNTAAATASYSAPQVTADGWWGAQLQLSPDLIKALSSSRVKDRNTVITALGRNINPTSMRLLQALEGNQLYYSRQNQLFYVQSGSSASAGYNELFTGSTLSSAESKPLKLRRVAVSTVQRQQINDLLREAALYSVSSADRLRAATALADSGANLPERTTLEQLLFTESDPEVYAALRTAWAFAALEDMQGGDQTLISAIELLAAKGNNTALSALQAVANNDLASAAVRSAANKAVNSVEFSQGAAAFAENLFFGLSLGSVLVLAAIGLAITFGVMGVINMAHGELIMIGAYCVWGLQQLLPNSPGLALLLSIPMAFIVSGAVGIVIERVVISRLYGRPLETLLATFGISLVLQQAVRTIFSPLNRAVVTPEFMQGSIQLTENLSVTLTRLYIIAFCAVIFALILITMNKTRLGLEVRAVSQNRPIARALGIHSSRVDALTFGLGSGVAGMAGVALSQITNVGPNLGQNYIVDTFMVVVFGGVGNLWGTLTGGLIMGLASKFLEPISGAMLSKIIILVALIFFIQKRPRGLFPQRGRAVEA